MRQPWFAQNDEHAQLPAQLEHKQLPGAKKNGPELPGRDVEAQTLLVDIIYKGFVQPTTFKGEPR